MNCYFELNELNNIKESIVHFRSLDSHNLLIQLNNKFNLIEDNLMYYSKVFKDVFDGADYDEFYYSCLALIETLNDTKIILNILKERDGYEK